MLSKELRYAKAALLKQMIKKTYILNFLSQKCFQSIEWTKYCSSSNIDIWTAFVIANNKPNINFIRWSYIALSSDDEFQYQILKGIKNPLTFSNPSKDFITRDERVLCKKKPMYKKTSIRSSLTHMKALIRIVQWIGHVARENLQEFHMGKNLIKKIC